MLSAVVDWLQARFGQNSVELCVQSVFVAGLEPGCQDLQAEILQFACSGPGLRLMESNHRASCLAQNLQSLPKVLARS